MEYPDNNDSSTDPASTDQEKPDLRPPPWQGLDAKRSGRILLVLAIMTGAMYLFVGYLYFLMISNPTVSEITLIKFNPLQNNMPHIDNLNLYTEITGLYVISSFIVGFWLSLSVRKVKIERFARVQLFTVFAPVFSYLPGMLLPIAREILFFIPPAMFVFAVTVLVHPENSYRKWLIYLCIFTIVPMLLGEGFLLAYKPLGAATMYLFMLAIGLCAISLIILARHEHLKRLLEADEAKNNNDPNRITSIPVHQEAMHETKPPRPIAARAGPRPAIILVSAGAVLFLAFLPPIWVLQSEPDLELNWQLGSDVETTDGPFTNNDLLVKAVVVNRGALAAKGSIELILQNATMNFTLGTSQRIDGFGSWYVEKTLRVPHGAKERLKINVTLLLDDNLLESQRLKMPGLSPLFALAAILIIKGIIESRRGRR